MSDIETLLLTMAQRIATLEQRLSRVERQEVVRLHQVTDNVASTSALTLTEGNIFIVSGSTTINHIETTDWYRGDIVHLLFDTNCAVAHQAGGTPANFLPVYLASGATTTFTSYNILSLMLEDTHWYQVPNDPQFNQGWGTVFPTSPAEGLQYYRTDREEWFYYDSSRSKWLSHSRYSDGAGWAGATGGATYLKRFNGMVMTATNGVYAIHDAVLIGFTWTSDTAAAFNYEVRRDGVAIATIPNGGLVDGGVMTLNVDINAPCNLSVYVSAGVTNPQVAMYWRRQAT